MKHSSGMNMPCSALVVMDSSLQFASDQFPHKDVFDYVTFQIHIHNQLVA